MASSEKKIANYILAHPDEIPRMSVKQLSLAADTSTAAVIRFCKAIEVQGFTDLKIHLSVANFNNRRTGYSDISANEPVNTIREKLKGNITQSVTDTINLIDNQRIQRAIDLIQRAPVLYTYGIGASALVAEDISQKWIRIGKHVLFPRDPHILVSSFASAPEQSVFWGISNSGETKEILKLVNMAQQFHISTIGLCQLGKNHLSQKAEVILHTEKSHEAILRSAATSSLHAQLSVVELIFFCYVSHRYAKTYHNILNSKAAIENYKNI